MIWVAEIGSAHGGNKSLAFEMIRQAKYAGATIAKFQFGWTKAAQKKYAGNYNEARYVDDWADDLADWCKYFDIELMASIWSMEGLDVALEVIDRVKIAHQMKDEKLIRRAELFWGRENMFISGENIICSDKYPTMPEDVDDLFWDKIGNFDGVRQFNDKQFGYSSHSHGIADALLAVSLGAQYIEKHVTLDKTNPFPRDNSFAITFDEFAQMVRLGDEMARLR